MGYTDPVPGRIPQILEYRVLWYHVMVSPYPKRGAVYYIFVAQIWLKLSQRKEALSEDETSIIGVYKSIWSVSRLKSFHLQQVTLNMRADPQD